MPTNSKDKMTLFLGNDLIKKIKIKAVEEDTVVSKVCRLFLDAWQSNLLGCEEYKNKLRLPKISAVYFITYDDKIIYVGQTVNLRYRLDTHHHASEFVKLQDKLIVFWLALDKDSLIEAEKVLIDLLDPDLNIKRDNGPSIPVRVFSEDEPTLRLLRSRLSVEHGREITSADTIRWLLDQPQARAIIEREQRSE